MCLCYQPDVLMLLADYMSLCGRFFSFIIMEMDKHHLCDFLDKIQFLIINIRTRTKINILIKYRQCKFIKKNVSTKTKIF